MTVASFFLAAAVLSFGVGASTRFWRDPATFPYFYAPFLMIGLFCWAFSQLWPILTK